VSSLASTLRRGASSAGQATRSTYLSQARLRGDVLLGLVLGGGLSAVTFVTSGGVALGSNTWTEILLLLLGAAAAIAIVLWGAPGRAWGAVTVSLLAALVVLTAVSISWSVQPNNSWIEANRTLSYLAVFGGGAALARLLPGRWAAVVGAVAIAATVVSGYALLVKVFPAALDPGETFGRLRGPFSYWNATGLMAALGVAPCLWAGARRDRAGALRGLSVPALAVLLSVIVLSYSRGALLVVVIGLACWFALVPLRLRSALILAVGAAGAAIITLYALGSHALTANLFGLDARRQAGYGFGVLLVLVLAALIVAGFPCTFAMDRVAVAPALRRRVGAGLVTLVALVPLAGVGAIAASSRGLTGEISHVWSTLTAPTSGVGNSATRLVQLGNSRGRYWRLGVKVGDHALLAGVGAAGYGTAVTRYTDNERVVAHAHSYVVETFADFGLIGIALMIAMLVSWAIAVWRPLRPPAERTRTARLDDERAGLLTLLAVVVVFGAHSAIDWTWFVPGTAIPALLCAGWLAARGPLTEPVGTRTRRPFSPGVISAMLAIVTIALLLSWAVGQPLRSADADSAALNAIAGGHAAAAITDARSAADADPVSIDPLLELSAIYSAAGQTEAAEIELVTATQRQSQNPASWLALGQFLLDQHQWGNAVKVLREAHRLDLGSVAARQALERALVGLQSS
jgi:cytochrome c-type biogenesis protein CcmH/NrfG